MHATFYLNITKCSLLNCRTVIGAFKVKLQIKLKQNLMLHLDDALFVMMRVMHTEQ